MKPWLANDPHVEHNPNFREELWLPLQQNEDFQRYAGEIEAIINQGLVAAVPASVLCEIMFHVMSRLDYSAVSLQMDYNPFWISLAICRLIHGRFEIYEEQSTVKFYRSPVLGPPMYPPHIKFLPPETGRAFGKAVLKTKEDEDQTIRSTRDRENNETLRVPSERVRERDETKQYKLFDVY